MRFPVGGGALSIVLLYGVLLNTSQANPLPARAIPELEKSIRDVLWQGLLPLIPAAAGPKLTDQLARFGFSTLLPETRLMIRREMRRFEPYIIESQRTAREPEMILHREFRAFACRKAKTKMCAVLRKRVRFPRELQSQARRDTTSRYGPSALALQPVLEFSEVLSDYGDRKALPLIQSVIDSLTALAQEIKR
jgi:hypothetical protein